MSNRRIAWWMSDKKVQKLNWTEFEKVCKCYDFGLFKLDLNKNLESQGTFSVFLHKLTDIIAMADQGDHKCANLIRKLEEFIAARPSLVILDPIPNVRQLLNRYISYRKITSTNLHLYDIFIPNFCELKPGTLSELSDQLKSAKVTFPLICKPSLGHGSKQSHEMSIVFNERGLFDCRLPCVAQSFINHNAVLYKIFIVGDVQHVVERPSLKNFSAGPEDTIHFDSGEVSKAGSKSRLTMLESHEQAVKIEPDADVFRRIAETLRRAFGMDLIGVDVVVENKTGKYTIIDVNVFPGYDGFPNFSEALMQCIDKKVNLNRYFNIDELDEDYIRL